MSRRLRWLGALALLCGCDADTGGQAITLSLSVESGLSRAEQAPHFVTDTGWQVTLEQACLVLGPVYVFENPPLGALAQAPTWRRPLDWLVPVAHAHPGHETFAGGAVKAEWVEQIAFDLLGPSPPPARINGLAGAARSFAVRLDPPRAALHAGCSRGHHAYVVGVAERGDVSIAFEGGLDVPDQGAYRRVEGLPLDAELSERTRLRLQVEPSAWFRDAHFDRLTQRAESGRMRIDDASQVGAAWLQGARSFSAFTARAEESE